MMGEETYKSMEKIFKQISIAVGVALVTWLIFGFVTQQFNPVEWSELGRLLYVAIVLIVAVPFFLVAP